MAITGKILKPKSVPGDLWYTVSEWTLDNSYALGGEPLTLRELGFGPEAVYLNSSIELLNGTEAEAQPITDLSYDGSKIHVIDGKTQKEVAETKDLSKVKFRITCYCTSG